MNHLKKVAILTTVVTAVFLWLTPGFTQGQLIGTVGDIENIENSNNPDLTPDEAPVQPEMRVIRGDRGPQGGRGLQGGRGPAGHDGKTVIREGHQGHRAPYQHIKSWNPASCSYVNARIEQARKKPAQATGHDNPQGKPAPKPAVTQKKNQVSHGWNRNWLWLLLIPLGWLIWQLWQYLRRVRPDLTNAASGNLFGIRQVPATIGLKFDGVAVRIIKRIYLGEPGRMWITVRPGEKMPVIKRRIGAANIFSIVVQNLDPSGPMPTDYIFPSDELASPYPHIVEAASLWLGEEKLRDLDENEMNMLTSGEPFPLSSFIDFVPFNETVQFKYRVRVIGKPGSVQTSSNTSNTGGV